MSSHPSGKKRMRRRQETWSRKDRVAAAAAAAAAGHCLVSDICLARKVDLPVAE